MDGWLRRSETSWSSEWSDFIESVEGLLLKFLEGTPAVAGTAECGAVGNGLLAAGLLLPPEDRGRDRAADSCGKGASVVGDPDPDPDDAVLEVDGMEVLTERPRVFRRRFEGVVSSRSSWLLSPPAGSLALTGEVCLLVLALLTLLL